MSKRNEEVILKEILENLEAILEFTNGMSKGDFMKDRKTQYAVDRCFEIVGEATRQLPDSFVFKHSQVEWNKMVAFRNLLIHEYFRVEREIQWNIIINIIPGLKGKIESIKAPWPDTSRS